MQRVFCREYTPLATRTQLQGRSEERQRCISLASQDLCRPQNGERASVRGEIELGQSYWQTSVDWYTTIG